MNAVMHDLNYLTQVYSIIGSKVAPGYKGIGRTILLSAYAQLQPTQCDAHFDKYPRGTFSILETEVFVSVFIPNDFR